MAYKLLTSILPVDILNIISDYNYDIYSFHLYRLYWCMIVSGFKNRILSNVFTYIQVINENETTHICIQCNISHINKLNKIINVLPKNYTDKHFKAQKATYNGNRCITCHNVLGLIGPFYK